MLYPYVEFSNELTVTYSQIIKDKTVVDGKNFSLF